jgi:hypothetical protein
MTANPDGAAVSREDGAAGTRRTSGVEAVLVTGAYGTGKTAVIEEIADILEGRHVRYAAIDLDWLAWFDAGYSRHSDAAPIMRRNLEAVVDNYLSVGVRRFALAGAMESRPDAIALRDAVGMPLTVVRLVVPIDEIERRLSSTITAGRDDDLRVARRWISEGTGQDVGDAVVANDRPIRDVALEVLSRVGW